MFEVQEYTVSDLAKAIKGVVEANFDNVKVRGELSSVKYAESGHVYFSLKDETAVIHGICWKGVAAKMPFKIEDGLEVVCSGAVSTYPGRSVYQITVDKMEVAGVGALLKILEQRKKTLAAEGLFDQDRKKKIPFLPEVIGIVTSIRGAVIKDIIHRIRDRFPVHLIVWDVLVQGPEAADQVASAIKGFHAMPSHMPTPDLIIVARGGGSIEDLWAFNEEVVVRTVAEASIPIISAVGHETDTTLIDFASDKRAPTPTAAAEMAVPVKKLLEEQISKIEHRLRNILPRSLQNKYDMLNRIVMSFYKSTKKTGILENRIAQLDLRMKNALLRYCTYRENIINQHILYIKSYNILNSIERRSMLLKQFERSMIHLIYKITAQTEARLLLNAKLLDTYRYTRTLERGFAVVRNLKGEVVTTSKSAKAELNLVIEFEDGKLKVEVENNFTQKPKVSFRKQKPIDKMPIRVQLSLL